MEEVLVSIDCLTYNHENYIAEAIEGFLMQKTTFKFEILIHDDASTDRTAEIIRSYEEKFPSIIKPIYQKENQLSLGIDVDQINERRARGKYIALCEGDDYWIDSDKLQKQVDYLEANPDCNLCVHAGYKFSERKKRVVGKVRPARRNRTFSVEETIEGGGGLFVTNSMMYRKWVGETVPAEYFSGGVGDYPLVIHLADSGRVYYLDETMSVYRIDVNDSWTTRMEANIAKAAIQNKETAELLDLINAHTNFRYNKTIERTKKKNRFDILLRQRKLKETFNKEYLHLYLDMDLFIRSVNYGLSLFQKRFIKT